MHLQELKSNIDEKWEGCWPLNTFKPIVILDLLSYLFFFKKISKNLQKDVKTASQYAIPNIKKETKILWDTFKNMDSQRRYEIFTERNLLAEVLQNNKTDATSFKFAKGKLLLQPTPKLLTNVVDIIKSLETKETSTQAEIYTHLLNKEEVIAANGQSFLPENLVQLIVSIIRPDKDDFILDPAAGNGSFLISCARFIASNENSKTTTGDTNQIDQGKGKLSGYESDSTNLRITALNMILNSIENPDLNNPGDSTFNINLTRKPTVIFSNLMFSLTGKEMRVEGDNIKEPVGKEILLLDFILKSCAIGTRVAIVVPHNLLYHSEAGIKAMREKIIDHFNLEAVIYLNYNSSSFSDAGILIFSKNKSIVTDKVWCYKMEQPQVNGENQPGESEELTSILKHFTSLGIIGENEKNNGFYITAEEIRAKNYSLNYHSYKTPAETKKITSPPDLFHSENQIGVYKIKKPHFTFDDLKRIHALPKIPGEINVKSISIMSMVFISIIILYFYGTSTNDATLQIQSTSVNKKESANNAIVKNTSAVSSTPGINSGSAAPNSNTSSGKYAVVSNAYFYIFPNENSKRIVYINALSKAEVTAQKEENGFIYVTYTFGPHQVESGWLNKKNLKPIP